MVDRARLESVCIERYRGFESLSLRWNEDQQVIQLVFFIVLIRASISAGLLVIISACTIRIEILLGIFQHELVTIFHIFVTYE